MKGFWIIGGLIIIGLSLLWVFAWWSAQTDPDLVLPPKPVFVGPGVLRIHDAQTANIVRVFDLEGRLVAQGEPFGRPVFELRFAWKPDTAYRVVTDRADEVVVHSPVELPQMVIRLHAPLGQEMVEQEITAPFVPPEPREIVVGARAGETLDFLLEVEKLTHGKPVELQASVSTEPIQSSGIRLEPAIENDREILQFEFDKRLWSFRVRLGSQLAKASLVVTVRALGIDWIYRVRFFNAAFDQSDLELLSWQMPTDREGTFRHHSMPNQMVLPNPFWSRLAAFFGIQLEVHDSFEPFSFQALKLRNKSDLAIGLVLRAEVLNPQTRKRVAFFDSPRFEVTGGTKEMIAFTRIGPFETQKGVLPLYLQPEVPEGTFLRRVTLTPLGSDQPLRVLEAPISVVRSDPLFAAWVLGIVLLSSVWVVVTGLFFRKLLYSLRIRLLVLLSLLGSLQFVLHFTGGLVSHVLHAFLGPFNCLVGGLLTEVLTYLLVTSILYLVPRVGAMTLAGLVTYIMGGVLFGSFGLADFLFVGSQIAFRELFLLMFGVTGFREAMEKQPPKLVLLVLALALADAASAFTSLALHSVFYRLFFARWYIFLQVAVAGFMYTAVGVVLGRSLGISLRRIHP